MVSNHYLVAAPRAARAAALVLNDVHARLSATRVAGILRPGSLDELCASIRAARERAQPLSIGGGRHAMGGQPFAEASLHLDMRGLAGVRSFDPATGLIEVGACTEWPELVRACARLPGPRGEPGYWGIAQKQTGADRLTIGGALAANIHGRGLRMRPFGGDVEAFTLVTPEGNPRHVCRATDPRLFALAVGGYGLFGAAASATLRLRPRRCVRRDVVMARAEEVEALLEARADAGYWYGDWQFAVEPTDGSFLREGICSCYCPVAGGACEAGPGRPLTENDWVALLRLAHTDKAEAFRRYCGHYLGTDGQQYMSDTHQLTTYVDDYHERIGCAGSEMIGELYVPRGGLAAFLGEARRVLRREGADVIYGTVRLIEPDAETVLAWARRRWACVVLNLHTDHSRVAVERTWRAFRGLIDGALGMGGSFYLTYGRYATGAQIRAAYPRVDEFLAAKREWDPDGVFQSTWLDWLRRSVGELDSAGAWRGCR